MKVDALTPFVAGALLAFIAVLSPISALAFSAACMASLLVRVLQDKTRQRKRDKIIADARMHTDLLTIDDYKEHLPPIKKALQMIASGK